MVFGVVTAPKGDGAPQGRMMYRRHGENVTTGEFGRPTCTNQRTSSTRRATSAGNPSGSSSSFASHCAPAAGLFVKLVSSALASVSVAKAFCRDRLPLLTVMMFPVLMIDMFSFTVPPIPVQAPWRLHDPVSLLYHADAAPSARAGPIATQRGQPSVQLVGGVAPHKLREEQTDGKRPQGTKEAKEGKAERGGSRSINKGCGAGETSKGKMKLSLD